MKLVTALILAFAAAAFAPQQPAPAASQPADPAQQEQKATNPPATATKATLYVYRLRERQGMFNKPSVYVDERELARIENGRFFVVNIDPGRHVVRSNYKASTVILEMKPGQVYYIRVAFEPTQYTYRAQARLVPPEQGWSEIGQTESSNPKDIKDHELVVVGAMPSKPASVPVGAKEAEPKEMVEGTLADALLQSDIKRMIRMTEAADHPNCGLQIVKQLHSADKPGVERWEVKSCDATSSYDVRMVPSPKGGVDFRVGKSVLEQEKKTDTVAQPPVSSQAGAADALPEGFVVYEGHKSQFTIAIPPGWAAYDQQQAVFKETPGVWGIIIFLPAPVAQGLKEFGIPKTGISASDAKELLGKAVELLSKVDTGEIPSFLVERLRADKEMSCSGFSKKAEKKLLQTIGRDAIFGKGRNVSERPHADPTTVGGCKGLRIRGRGQTSPGVESLVDVYAASDGETLYLFTLRPLAENYAKNGDVFQKAISTAKLSAAK